MKNIIRILLIILFSSNSLIAQKLKKENSMIKSDNPLEIKPNLNFEVTSNLDSTQISKESFQKLKKILILVEKEENSDAVILFNSMDEKDIEKGELLILKGILEFKLDDMANCSNSLSKYISISSNDSIKGATYYMLGVIDLKRQMSISAYHNFKKSYELDTTNFTAAISLGTLSMNNKDFKNAIFYYEKVLETNPELNNVWNNLGFIYQVNGNHIEAKKIFSKIIKDEPKSPLPYNNRGYSNLQLGFTKEALSDVNKSISLFPENSYAFRNRALINIALNKFEQACKDIDTALKLGYTEKYGADVDELQYKHCKK